MGTSRSAAQLSGKLVAQATALPRAQRDGITTASRAAKNTMEHAMFSAGYGRTVGGKHRWSVGFNVKGLTNATSLIRYRGSVPAWAFGGTGPHIIAAKLLGTRNQVRSGAITAKTGRARGQSTRGSFGPFYTHAPAKRGRAAKARSGKKALKIPGIGYRAYVFHPGHRPKANWGAVKSKVERQTGPIMRNEIARSLAKNFRN